MSIIDQIEKNQSMVARRRLRHPVEIGYAIRKAAIPHRLRRSHRAQRKPTRSLNFAQMRTGRELRGMR